jgi:hypothetical protein
MNMQEKLWKFIGFWAMGLILFMATMIIIRWLVDFVTWTTLDSGWAQATGSIAALGVAIYVMSRQNAHAARLVIDADRRTALRLVSSVGALIDRANTLILSGACEMESSASCSYAVLFNTAERIKASLAETKTALAAIPPHELGCHELVVGLIQMIECIRAFESTLQEVCSSITFPPEVIPGRARDVRTSTKIAMDNFEAGKAALARQ